MSERRSRQSNIVLRDVLILRELNSELRQIAAQQSLTVVDLMQGWLSYAVSEEGKRDVAEARRPMYPHRKEWHFATSYQLELPELVNGDLADQAHRESITPNRLIHEVLIALGELYGECKGK